MRKENTDVDRKAVCGIILTLLLTGMLTLAFNIQPVKAEPKTWYVDDSGGADFTKIQDAIYAASPGDTIYVYNGTYYENLHVSKDNLTIVGESKSNTIIDGSGKVVIDIYSSRVVVSAFTVRNGGQSRYYVSGSAIILNHARSCNISDNLVSDSRYGIVAYYVGKHIISGNTIRNTNQGIAFYYSNNNTVFGNAVSEGVQVGSDPPYGIQVYGGGFFNLIMENIVTNINYTGIRTTYAARNVIVGNTVSNTSVGISASHKSFLNTITGNVVSNNSIGVEIWDSNNNTVVDNSISTSMDRGISLEISYNNKIIGNTLSDNNYGINVGTSHDNEVSDNTVANCTNEGIMMGRSFSNTVTNNTITESNIAVYLGDSHSNNISENTATSNVWGLWLVDSKDNEANHNRIINNRGGILVLGTNSSGNIIRENIIKNTTNAQSAIFLHTCNNNTIYHNNFVEDVLPQIFNYASVNIWDDGYPSGGNYWSDYAGVDADGDGIGDTPYVIDATNQDRYPLMHPWSPLPVHNVNTGLGYATIQEAINANETINGHTIFVETGTYYENVVVNKTVSLVGENKTMTIINGNMTGTTVTIKAFNATIKEFTITNGTNGGLVIFGSSDITVTNNFVTNNYGPKYSYYFSGAGIIAYNSMSCIISQNLVSSNDETAIEVRSSDNVTVDANNIDRNGGGIFISDSSSCTLKCNNITGHRLNFGVYGWSLSSYIHDIDSSNTINGKPILYFVNQQGLRINPATFPEVGYLALINSTDIIVKDFVFKENYQGILLIATNNSAIQNVIVSNNTYGIHSFYSGGNEIINCVASENENGIFMRYSKTGNIFVNLTASSNGEGLFIGDCGYINITSSNISNNEWYGIYLTACYYGENDISHNIITNNVYGIRLDFSPSLVRENMIINNDVGLWLSYSKNSAIFHNSFMNNIKQVHYEYSTPTNWDDGYPSGGNYWSDYAGVDEKSGLNQDQPGSDGIGDIPYQIPILDTWGGIIGYDYDNYPLMKPWGPIKMVLDVIWDDIIYPVTVVSNSTIDDFNFSQPLKQISFNVAGPDGTIGFCNVTIPKALLWVETPDEWTLLIDGSLPIFLAITENATHNSLYFTYTHSTHEARIIGTHAIAPPPPPLSASISPLSASIPAGQSVTFTSTVSGGVTPYSYQWYLNGAPVSGATSASWTFTPKTSGIYYVYLKVTDDTGNTTQSETARITVATVPVGGYSVPIQLPTAAKPATIHIALLTILTVIFITIKRKAKRKH